MGRIKRVSCWTLYQPVLPTKNPEEPNIFLAATSEGLACSMRIPPNEEHDRVKTKLKVPAAYMIPAFIGMGYADPNEPEVEQGTANLEEQVHSGRWK